jgi:integrase
MKIRETIFRRKTGKSKGSWILRLSYADESGRAKTLERVTASRSAARDLADRLTDELKKTHGNVRSGDKMTFKDLVGYCERHYYKPAEYSDGRKVAGVRGLKSVKTAINVLKDYFGEHLLRDITRTSLFDYKSHRLATISKRTERPISIATVNRELATLRRMIKIAFAEGWIVRDPFFGTSIISIADESPRERILSREEETRLLAACVREKRVVKAKRYGKPLIMEIEVDRTHLRPLIVLALDTGMRRGELFKLRWDDVDFVSSSIVVRATHTKTQRERLVPLTARAARELQNLRTISRGELVFPFEDLKRSFTAVRDEVGLPDLRFHDLRHTAITRMVRGGISAAEAGKIAGHSQPTTTYRYVNTDIEALNRVASVLDAYAATPATQSQEVSTAVN